MKKWDMKGLKGDIRIISYFLKLVNTILPSYIPLIVIAAFFKAIAPFINIVMPKFILDELMGQQRIHVFALLVGGVVIGNGVFNLINSFFATKVDIANSKLVNGFELHLGRHIMSMDFESLENPKILNLKDQALFPITNQGVLWRMVGGFINLLQIVLTLIGLVALISTINIGLVGVIIGIVLINSFIFKRLQALQFKFNQELIPLNRGFSYYASLASDFSMGKDVRIYNMPPYILSKIDEFNEKSLDGFKKVFGMQGKYEGISNINLQFQMIIVYTYMVWKVFKGAISVGDFTMYISATNNFSTQVSQLLTQFIEIRQMCRYLDLYLQFEALPIKVQKGSKEIGVLSSVNIEFKNVWFKYPEAEDYTLKDVSLTLNSGEKMSIVGQNGAGKTTFIKLLCRLYEPERGEILINGVNVKEYAFDEYTKLLSVVFQDYKLFSFTIQENMSFNQACNQEELEIALQKSGVRDKVASLDKGVETSLYKNFDKEGTELSGGEMQKLAIARAIYKNAPIVVLDEPTAALDPYAEYEIYAKFNELVKNKTAIYISHRLSSCRFCDKIAVFDNGRLIEQGTHTELKEQNGKYAQMWKAQAQYYV